MVTLDEAFEKLRSANQPVPKPRRLPTAEEVQEVERDLGMSFHPEYRRFQLEMSDVVAGVLEPAGVVPGLPPYKDLRRVVQSTRDLKLPRDLLPFCKDNGNFFLIDPHGRILYWDHDDDSLTVRHTSLADWIVEGWLLEIE